MRYVAMNLFTWSETHGRIKKGTPTADALKNTWNLRTY